MNFTKFFKIVSITLFALSVIASVLYVGYASNKNCLACTLPVCEKMDAKGEKYLAPSDSCAMSFSEIKKMEDDIRKQNAELGTSEPAEITECCEECLDYAGNFMWFTIIMSIAAVVLTLLFTVYQFIVNPKKVKTAIFGIVAMGVVVLISYLLASSEIPQIIGYNNVITPFETKSVDTLLYMFYILFSVALIGIVYSSISKIFKK